MPQIGWLCVFTKEPKTVGECLECSKSESHCEFTPEMLALMSKGMRRKPKDPRRLSVTQLLGCPRKMWIINHYNYRVSPRRAWFLLRGNMIHQVMQGAALTDGWKEIYKRKEIELIDGTHAAVGGIADKIVIDKLLIRDYKTTAKLPTKMRSSYGTHNYQLNIYRWLWWDVFHAEKLRLQYMDMRGTKQVKVELMDIDEIEEFIRVKASDIVRVLEAGELPEDYEYNPKEWVYRYCDVSDICKDPSSGELYKSEKTKVVRLPNRVIHIKKERRTK